ncbi:glycosyltransferase [Riemerella columbina]|uniref:glycosyltransferase n=1 Tax=Riemerella columbina TaxID=103810 RepID=UPI0026708872|nr:glycosyltransferase [Riemerella columbina]WKS94936.1 glycosyltransferase [Riemerella columbina]
MKILQIINSVEIGGAETLLIESLDFYKKEGVEMDVLALKKADTFLSKKVEEEQLNYTTLTQGSVYNPLLIFKIIPYLRKYDVVHTHLFPALYWVVLAKWLSFSKTPIVYTEHSTHNKRREHFLLKWIDRVIYRGVRKIVSISDDVDRKIKEHLGFPQDRFQLINNGVDIAQYATALPYKKTEFFGEQDFILVQVSSFRYPKDQKTLIKALALLPENVKLLLIGIGELEEECKKMVQNLNLEQRVQFLGLRNDVPRILKTSDITILSSHYEGLSLSCIEGMASGKPFVASQAPGLENIVKGYGVVFEPNNEKDLAEKILLLMTDSNLYNKIAEKCQQRSLDYHISKMVKRYIDVYKESI